MKRLLVLVLLMACFVPLASAQYLIGGTVYSNGTQFYVNVSSAGALTNHQQDLILTNSTCVSGNGIICTNGTTLPTWTDIIFTDGSDISIPYWIWNNTGTSTSRNVTIKISNLPLTNTSVRVYYGNSTKTSSSMNIYNTYPFGDDFNDAALNTTQWTKDTSGSVTQSNGIITVAGEATGYNSGITGKTSFDTSAYKIIFRTTGVYANGYDQAGWASEENGANPAYLIQARTESGGVRKYSTMNAGALNAGSWAWVVGNVQQMYRTGSTAYFYDYSGVSTNTATSVPTVNLNASIVSTSIAGDYISVDWMVVEDYQANPPTTSLFTKVPDVVPPTASFTCTPTSATLGTAIACTDTSTGSPTNWIYYWNDGTISTTQNPSHTYGSFGIYSVNQTVNNSAGSSWYNRSNYITITNVSGFTQQDLWQTGHYTKTLHIVDSSNAPIPVVTVTDSNGQSYTTTNGTAYFTEDAGVVIFYFASTGYVSKSMSYVIDGDSEDTVQMVASVNSTLQQNTWYTPKQISITVVSYYPSGKKMPGAHIELRAIGNSLQADSQLQTIYGINPEAANQMLNGTLIMNSTTDLAGVAVFTVLASINYLANVTDPSTGKMWTATINPGLDPYTIWIGDKPNAINTTEIDSLNQTRLWAFKPDNGNWTMNMQYRDLTGKTTEVRFVVKSASNLTEVYNVSLGNPGTSLVLANKTYRNVIGDGYYYYWVATRG